MRFRWVGILALFLGVLLVLYLSLHLDPIRTGLAFLLFYGGYWLVRSGAPGSRTAMTGVVHLMDREYPLQGIDLTCGIADVIIDLSRAIIPAGEHQIRVNGMVGNVAIYVPYDLDVSVTASAPLGSLNIMKTDRDVSGLSDRKVKIAVSLVVGDVSVRYL